MLDLDAFPQTTNLALAGPHRLTVAEFNSLPVPPEQLQARQSIRWLEQFINDAAVDGKLNPDSLTPVHRFTKGIYTRELTMPPGTIIVGKRHAQEHLVMMTEGFCTVLTERGWEDLHAPCTFTSPAGEKRVLFVHEQTTWVTIHRTDAETLEDVEADLILQEQYPVSINSAIETRGSE
jgi:hypothetical protein